MKTILIIGGGLGGLALTQLLQTNVSSDVKVIVFERDSGEDSRDQGNFITLNSMGIDVLKRIPAIEIVLSDSSTISHDQCQLEKRSLLNEHC